MNAHVRIPEFDPRVRLQMEREHGVSVDEIAPLNPRLNVKIDVAAARSLIRWFAKRPCDRPHPDRFVHDLRRQYGDEQAERFVDLILVTWKSIHEIEWNGAGRDLLLIDLADEAMAFGWRAPHEVVAAVERLRSIATERRAERDAREDAELMARIEQEDREMNEIPQPTPCDDSNWGYGDERDRLIATPFQWINPASIPERQWLYGRSLIRRQLMVTVAHPGVGKSSISIVDGLAMAIGRKLLHEQPHGRCRVWLWNGEDPLDELQRRVTAAAMHYKISPAELNGWLFVDSGRQSPMVIARTTRDGTVIAEPVFEALATTIAENRIDVMVIDPFVSCHAVSENDNVAIDAVVKTYARIADVTGCAIHLVHHARKTGGEAVDAEHARGASALMGAVRSARTINAMTADEASKAGVKERHRLVRIDEGKTNLAPRSDVARWIELRSVYLGNGSGLASAGDSVGVPVPWHWPNPMEGMTADKLTTVFEAITAGGPWRENAQANDWVGKPIAAALGLDIGYKADKAKVSGMVREWISVGMLVVVTANDDKRRERHFVEIGKWERHTLTPGRFPGGVAAPPPPATL